MEEKRRTLENVAGKVALVLAAAGSGGRAVGVGVLPLLEEFFGLVEEDLARGRESVTVFLEEELYRRGGIGVVQGAWWSRKVCGSPSRGRRVAVRWKKVDGRDSLSVVWARGRWRWLQRESECTWPGRARGNGGRTSQGPA